MLEDPVTEHHSAERKGKETRLFIFLVVFFFPLLSVALVAGYGFAVWIFQMLAGPPGPPV